MRTLVYKMTHKEDPGVETGVFGKSDCRKSDCMGKVRRLEFGAVIGIGGKGNEASREGIARKLVWMGIGPHKQENRNLRGPLVTFDHFLHFGDRGPHIEAMAPKLAERMYDGRVRYFLNPSSETEIEEIDRILQMAKTAPPSSALLRGIRRSS